MIPELLPGQSASWGRQTIVLQYVVPEDAEEGIVISRVIAFSDNGQRLEVATPLRITGEDEE
ncbi:MULTISPECIES: hypothetical protein [Paenibacillus]|uniref:Uncharacterized protein n=1 Tax=Paenibacillus lautus TaxID=1401 RepID=A0A1R1B0Q2_PAELA|nr:hypothetical protein [Paenibacillus lautus]OME92118.1 hypothetical protein BK123_15945 [Paenibacillus lautus]